VAARGEHQQGERKVAYVTAAENDVESSARVAAFRQGLRLQGWAEDRNIRLEFRWALADLTLMQRYAAELVAVAPDVIVVLAPQGLAAVQRETRSIPTVFVQVADPVGGGFVASLAKPGGNITGFTASKTRLARNGWN
jgi:putative ABC transport system substrate-binding protein